MLLHGARLVTPHMREFRGHMDKLCQYLQDLGPIKQKEARRFVTGVLESCFDSSEEAKEGLTMMLRAMRIAQLPSTTRCISPSLDRSIYMGIMRGIPQTFWDPQNPPILFNFSDPEVIKQRVAQLNENRSHCCDPIHTKDAGCVLLANSVRNFWEGQFQGIEYVELKAGPRPAGPIHQWDPNAFDAVIDKKYELLRYILWLVPELILLPRTCDNMTIVHLAARNGDTKRLRMYHDMGYDFSKHTNCVWDPIHVAASNCQNLLLQWGAAFNAYDENGESYLHEALRCGNHKIFVGMAEAILGSGEDVRRANVKGTFWLQAVFHEMKHDEEFYSMLEEFHRIVARDEKGIYDDEMKRIAGLKIQEMVGELEQAVQRGDVERVRDILALGITPNVRFRSGLMPLAYCVQKSGANFDACAAMLAANFADPNLRQTNGYTPFRVACMNHNFKAAEALLAQGADPTVLANDGRAAIHYAFENDDLECLEFCLAHTDVNLPNKEGVNITFMAFLKRDDALGERLQDKYGGHIRCQDKLGNTLAHLAFREGDYGRISYLITRGVDLNVINKAGKTVLMDAVAKSELSVCETLIRGGARVDIPSDKGSIALVFAKDLNVTRLLLDNGSEVDTFASFGLTPLMIAARDRRPDCCQLLLDRGANIGLLSREKKYKEMTPLHLVFLEDDSKDIDGMLPIIDIFISKLENPDLQDGEGRTPLFMAACHGRMDVCSKLIATGRVDVHARTKSGATVFWGACGAPVFSKDLFDLLLGDGRDVDIADKDGMLPLARLIQNRQFDTALNLIRTPTICRIIDISNSKYSPILMACDAGSQILVEELIDRGVDAYNSERSVVTAYCRQSFFRFDVFRKMKRYRVLLQGPIPTLMRWERWDVARYLWDISPNLREKISGTVDCNDRTPLMLCLLAKQNQWASELISSDYDLVTEDCNGDRPIILCAKFGYLDWTRAIYNNISIKHAGAMNNEGCSALTYAAINEWHKLCDRMFVDGIQIPKVWDRHGIIRHYDTILDELSGALENGKKKIKELETAISRGSRKQQQLSKDLFQCRSDAAGQTISRRLDKLNQRMGQWQTKIVERNGYYNKLQQVNREMLLRDLSKVRWWEKKLTECIGITLDPY